MVGKRELIQLNDDNLSKTFRYRILFAIDIIPNYNGQLTDCQKDKIKRFRISYEQVVGRKVRAASVS